VEGQIEEIAIAWRKAMDGDRGRIDQGVERAGECGFAAAGGSVEDEDGVGAGGSERGGEPGEDGDPLASVQVEEV
jgi:hypothetical protein